VKIALVTPENFLGMIERLKNFIEPFITHLRHQVQRDKILDYIKGLLSDVERKNTESISYFRLFRVKNKKTKFSIINNNSYL
jgi:hypothetical protein